MHLEPEDDDDEGCGENFGPSLINRYVFGKGNVLITGQAAGFLNIIAEGMSCALHSGAISGEAIIEAREAQGDEPKWFISIVLFAAVWLVLILTHLL